MQANLHKALSNFNQETMEQCGKEAEFKVILFALCYFHAVVAERRKFGPQGWNKIYPFNVGDLNISVFVLFNYLEANSKVPWEDLRYLFGEIMYGGHITDDWDRRLCNTYLEELLQPDLVSRVNSLLFCNVSSCKNIGWFLVFRIHMEKKNIRSSSILAGFFFNVPFLAFAIPSRPDLYWVVGLL